MWQKLQNIKIATAYENDTTVKAMLDNLCKTFCDHSANLLKIQMAEVSGSSLSEMDQNFKARFRSTQSTWNAEKKLAADVLDVDPMAIHAFVSAMC